MGGTRIYRFRFSVWDQRAGWRSARLSHPVFVRPSSSCFATAGHFLVARWCGVRVLVFSIGFGPDFFGFNDRHNARWKLCVIPLGGYLKFFGDDNAASVADQAGLPP